MDLVVTALDGSPSVRPRRSSPGRASGVQSAGRATAIGPGDRRGRAPSAGRLVPAGARPGRGRRPAAGADRLPAGGPPPPSWVAPERVRFTARDGLPIEANLWRPDGHRRAAQRRALPRDRLRPRRADGQQLPVVAAVQAAPRPGGLRPARRGLPGLDRLRPDVPRGESRRVGPRRRVRLRRCRPLARRAGLVRRPAGGLRRLVRRLPDPVLPGRGAVAVASRGRPVRRLGDRRELSPRRSAGPDRPPSPDGQPRRSGRGAPASGAARRSTRPSGSRRPCWSCTAARTAGSCP